MNATNEQLGTHTVINNNICTMNGSTFFNHSRKLKLRVLQPSNCHQRLLELPITFSLFKIKFFVIGPAYVERIRVCGGGRGRGGSKFRYSDMLVFEPATE